MPKLKSEHKMQAIGCVIMIISITILTYWATGGKELVTLGALGLMTGFVVLMSGVDRWWEIEDE